MPTLGFGYFFRVEWFIIYKKYSVSRVALFYLILNQIYCFLECSRSITIYSPLSKQNTALICTENRRGPSLVLGSPGQFHQKTKDLTLLQTVTNIDRTEVSTADE
jgi:hypothetical protein